MTEHFSTLYSVTILDHHVYDQLSKMWLRRSSEPQPYTMLTATPVGEDYADLGFPLKSRTSILPSMADTGCQSCLGGMKLLPHLGVTADDLIPVSTKTHAANGKGIKSLVLPSFDYQASHRMESRGRRGRSHTSPTTLINRS